MYTPSGVPLGRAAALHKPKKRVDARRMKVECIMFWIFEELIGGRCGSRVTWCW